MTDETAVRVDYVPWPVRAECHRCGGTDLEAVCHHCGCAICRRDLPATTDSSGRLLSHEYVGVGLEKTACGEAAIHCESCRHVIRPLRAGLLVPGVVAFVAGRFLQLELGLAGLAVMAVGVLATLAAAATYARRWWAFHREPSRLPWVPRLSSLEISETVEGAISLDAAGDYHTQFRSCQGRVVFDATLGTTEKYGYECYSRRFGLERPSEVPIFAGFLLLEGRACLDFDDGSPIADGCVHALPLAGTTSESGARRAIEGSVHAEWRREWSYRPEPGAGVPSLPLEVVPYVLPESGGRRLRLELRWGSRVRPEEPIASAISAADLQAVLVEKLELTYPIGWGEAETFGERVQSCVEADGREPVRRVVWRKVVIRPEEEDRGHRCFEVRFETPIDLRDRIEGLVDLDLKGSLTGVEGVRWFLPTGESSGRRAPAVTRLHATFSLALACLRHREVRLVPDAKRPDEQPISKPVRIDGVVPNHSTVIAVTKVLAEHGCYLKSVIEDRPRTGAAAGSVTRLWDIAGKVDDTLHPNEFHLVLSGDEIVGGGAGGLQGGTSMTLSVQGAFSDTAQEEAVRSRWDRLRELVETTLRARVRGASAASPDGAPGPRPPESGREAAP